MSSLLRVLSNLTYYAAYSLSWCLWQMGGKQIRRALIKSFDQIETADAARARAEALEIEEIAVELSPFDFEHPRQVNLTVDMWIDCQTDEWFYKFKEEPDHTYGPFPNSKIAELRSSAEIARRQVERQGNV